MSGFYTPLDNVINMVVPFPSVVERTDPLTECYKGGNDAGMCFFPQFNNFVRLEVIACGHLAYVLVIVLLKFLMKGRPAINPQGLMTVYNATQVFLSVTMSIALAPHLFSGLTIFNLTSKFHASIEFWIFVHYMTKYLDMFDTVWMVLRHKNEQISFLHVYHHLTIGAIWGVLLHYGIGNGTAFYGAWINSVVHSLMYFHYLVTSYGINNPMKKYLTQFQIAQFFSCVGQAILTVVIPGVALNYPIKFAYLQLVYHCTLIVLFVNFYRKSTAKAKAAAAAKKAAKKQ